MELVYAGVIILFVIFAYFLIGEKRVKKKANEVEGFLNWMNTDMLTSIGVFTFCAWVWLYLNLENGNVVALKVGFQILNELSLTGLNMPSEHYFTIAAAVPSVIQWWLMQFSPSGSARHTIGWWIVGFDILLTTAGYWFSAGLTTNPWELTLLHLGVGAFFLLVAAVVNGYLELLAHDTLARFWLTIRGKDAKGDLNKKSSKSPPSRPTTGGARRTTVRRRRRRTSP